jgi:hypothetical protein
MDFTWVYASGSRFAGADTRFRRNASPARPKAAAACAARLVSRRIKGRIHANRCVRHP